MDWHLQHCSSRLRRLCLRCRFRCAFVLFSLVTQFRADPYQKHALGIFVAMVMFAEMLLTMLIFRTFTIYVRKAKFNPNPWIRAFCALFLFSCEPSSAP